MFLKTAKYNRREISLIFSQQKDNQSQLGKWTNDQEKSKALNSSFQFLHRRMMYKLEKEYDGEEMVRNPVGNLN